MKTIKGYFKILQKLGCEQIELRLYDNEWSVCCELEHSSGDFGSGKTPELALLDAIYSFTNKNDKRHTLPTNQELKKMNLRNLTLNKYYI